MSTSPITGGVPSSTQLTVEGHIDTGTQAASISSGAAPASYLDLGFLQVTHRNIGIASPSSRVDTSVLVAEVLAENEELRLQNEGAKNSSLSGRIQTALATNAAGAAQLAALKAQVTVIEDSREVLNGQRISLQTSLDAKQSELGTLNIKITNNQSQIDTQSSLIGQINAALATLNGEEETDLTARQALQQQIDVLNDRLVQLQTNLAGLEATAVPDAGQSLRAVADAIDGSLAPLQAELAALGENDADQRASLEAKIALLVTLGSELRTVLSSLTPDMQAGATQTLEGFSEALSNAADNLEERIRSLLSSDTADTPEIAAHVAAMRAQVGALEALAIKVDARASALTDSDDPSQPVPDPGAAEGLRIVANVLFGSVSGIQGQIASSSLREHGAGRSLERSTDNLNAAIAALETERDGLGDEATPAEIDAYTTDIASLRSLVALLETKRASMPASTGANAEALQAEIGALNAFSDELAEKLRIAEVSGRVGSIVAADVSRLIESSVTNLAQDLRNVDDAVFHAGKAGTLVGLSSTAEALNRLIGPLESQVTAYADASPAAAIAALQSQIAVLSDSIATLRQQFNALDPADDANARTLLENQLAAAIALKNSATAELTTLNASKPQIMAQITSLNNQVKPLDQQIAQKDAQIAVKNDEFNTILKNNPQTSSTAADIAQAHKLASSLALNAEQDGILIDDLLTELRKIQSASATALNWTKAPHGHETSVTEGGPKQVPKAQSLALSVVAVQEALGLLRAGVPDQADPKRIKLSM